MSYRLVCGKDAREVGIEDMKGNWNLDKFKKHVVECSECKKAISEIIQRFTYAEEEDNE